MVTVKQRNEVAIVIRPTSKNTAALAERVRKMRVPAVVAELQECSRRNWKGGELAESRLTFLALEGAQEMEDAQNKTEAALLELSERMSRKGK